MTIRPPPLLSLRFLGDFQHLDFQCLDFSALGPFDVYQEKFCVSPYPDVVQVRIWSLFAQEIVCAKNSYKAKSRRIMVESGQIMGSFCSIVPGISRGCKRILK